MSLEDKIKWDRKYQEQKKLLEQREPSLIVKKYCNGVDNKRALDLACGSGRHALYLAQNGFSVDAVDISKVALNTLKSRAFESITTIEADLDSYMPKPNSYNLIVKTNFLDRALIERAKEALCLGGLFIVETYMEDSNNEKQNSNSNYLLKIDELPKIFAKGFEILEYKTFWNEPYEKYRMKKAAIVARKLEEL